MSRVPLLVILALLALIIATLHVVAITFYLYWTIWWLDILQHFLAGLWIALLMFWFIYVLRLRMAAPFITTPRAFLMVTLAATLAIGISWEVFEYVVQVYFADNYVFDTISDLATDLVGAFTGYAVLSRSALRFLFS